jgi:cell division protein FtsW (lipid II flippase)
VKECPHCKLTNPDNAERCDCGYDFPTGTMQSSLAVLDSGQPSSPKQPKDYTGLIIGAALLPVFIVFAEFDKPDMGLAACIVLVGIILAVKIHWKWRRHIWFWTTVVFILVLHAPLVLKLQLPHDKTPIRAYATPFGIADFLIISGALRLAERLFSKDSPSDDEP